MSLYRRGRLWWIDFTTDTRRVREPTGTADRKAAEEYLARRKIEVWREEKLDERPAVTWGEAVATWLGLKERSMPERYMLRSLGFEPSESLPLPSTRIQTRLQSLSSSSQNRYLNLVVAVHNSSGVAPPSLKRTSQPNGRLRWLTKEEWLRLRKALAAESGLLLQLADFSVATGVRENNALELEWSQVDLRRHMAWFYADQMKGRDAHGIPLNDDAIAVLKARAGLNERYVFAHPESGKPLYKASNRAWYNALRRSRLKATGVVWHTLRHTWASWFVMNGGSLQELMQLGGWKTYSMVLRYSHLSTAHLAAAAARVKPVSLRYNTRRGGIHVTKSPTSGA